MSFIPLAMGLSPALPETYGITPRKMTRRMKALILTRAPGGVERRDGRVRTFSFVSFDRGDQGATLLTSITYLKIVTFAGFDKGPIYALRVQAAHRTPSGALEARGRRQYLPALVRRVVSHDAVLEANRGDFPTRGGRSVATGACERCSC